MIESVSNSPIIGIDLGTSNCCIALWGDGEVEVVRNRKGNRTTPSVVTIGPKGGVIVGVAARRQAIMNPEGTISEVKRLVGLPHDSPAVKTAMEVLPYKIVRAPNGDAHVKIGDRTLSPQETQAYILEELAAAASQYLGELAQRVVVTVPAFFDETQRQAVRDAAQIAGLYPERILSEPAAAALAYGYAQLDNRKLAVVDLGGGTLDVAVMSVDQGNFSVLATDGDNLLGGADFDRALARAFAAQIKANDGIDVTEDPVAMQRLLSEAEQVKKTLTQQKTADVSLPYLAQNDGKAVNFDCKVTRDEYETMVSDLVDRLEAPCRRAVEQAGLLAKDLDDVILIGGMTRSPVVQQRIQEIFQRKPQQRINPDEAVAMGAALLGAGINGDLAEVTFVDVVPRTVGLRAAGDKYVPLISKSRPLPAVGKKTFSTTQDQQKNFDLEILQGESMVASENRPLANVSISPIRSAPKGEVILDIEITMDVTGVLSVFAKERGTDTLISSTISPFSGLTRSQVLGLAEKHAEERGTPMFDPASLPAKPAILPAATPAPAAMKTPTPKAKAPVKKPPARVAAATPTPPAKKTPPARTPPPPSPKTKKRPAAKVAAPKPAQRASTLDEGDLFGTSTPEPETSKSLTPPPPAPGGQAASASLDSIPDAPGIESGSELANSSADALAAERGSPPYLALGLGGAIVVVAILAYALLF